MIYWLEFLRVTYASLRLVQALAESTHPLLRRPPSSLLQLRSPQADLENDLTADVRFLDILIRPFEVAFSSTAPDRRAALRRGAINTLSSSLSRAN